MRDFGVRVMVNNEEVCKAADIVFLAVKPQYMQDTLASTKKALDDKCVISIAAGLSSKRIREMIDAKPRVLRTMPNTPANVPNPHSSDFFLSAGMSQVSLPVWPFTAKV